MASFRDRFFLVRLTRDESKIRTAFGIIVILGLLLGINSVYLTVLSLKTTRPSPTVSPTPGPTPIQSGPSPTVQQEQPVVVQQPVAKEYFVAFGSGTNQTSDWADVPGLVATIDFGNYPSIKEVHFEASVVIPTANETASVRLFNETDKHPVWYSEITLVNGQFVSSNPIIYDTGMKTYQVQMKTSLQYTANLIQSRLHIILQ